MKILILFLLSGAVSMVAGGSVLAKLQGAKKLQAALFADNNIRKPQYDVDYPVKGSLVTLTESLDEDLDCYLKVVVRLKNTEKEGCTKKNFPKGCNSIKAATFFMGNTECQHKIKAELQGRKMKVTVNDGDTMDWSEFSTRIITSGACDVKVDARKWGNDKKPMLYMRRKGECSSQYIKFVYHWNQLIVSENADRAPFGGVAGL